MMNKKEIATYQKKLIAWYLQNCRELPWRKTDDPYDIWVSEVMLQQTQVNTVVPYYHKFLKKFPTVKHLAQAKLQAVLKTWEGMGYYARARNLRLAAGIVQDQYAGEIPDTWDAFRALPGVGDYIAAAVLSIAFNQPYAVVDGNVKRVLARLQCIPLAVNDTGSAKTFKSLAADLIAERTAGTYNQALMELGALICKPGAPLCEACPVQMFCKAYRTDSVAIYPRKITRRPTPLYHIAVGVVIKGDRILITQRKPDGLLGGLWEFPGGKIKKGEKAKDACAREIREEVNLEISIIHHLARVRHAYTHFKISMDVFCCQFLHGRVKRNGPVDHRWIRISAVDRYPLPRANHKFLPKLKKWLEAVS